MASAPPPGSPPRSPSKKLALSIFKKHDKDGSGALDRSEAAALIDDFCKTLNLDLALREKEMLLNEQFVAADANGDGTLCWEEYQSLAAYLDTIATALEGSVDAYGEMEPVRVEKGTGCAAALANPLSSPVRRPWVSARGPSSLLCVPVGRAGILPRGVGSCWTSAGMQTWCVAWSSNVALVRATHSMARARASARRPPSRTAALAPPAAPPPVLYCPGRPCLRSTM